MGQTLSDVPLRGTSWECDKKEHKSFFKNQISIYLFKSDDIVSYGLLQMLQCIMGKFKMATFMAGKYVWLIHWFR